MTFVLQEKVGIVRNNPSISKSFNGPFDFFRGGMTTLCNSSSPVCYTALFRNCGVFLIGLGEFFFANSNRPIFWKRERGLRFKVWQSTLDQKIKFK